MKVAEIAGGFVAVLMLACAVAEPGHAQDAEHGKAVFKACATCHATDHANRVGPGLGTVVGRTAGTVPGFHYSNAMKNSGVIWDAKTLDAYLEAPQKVVPGNSMPYGGLKDATDRTDLVAYLTALK
ncbi:cytochrome c family protein [Bradyrhizobium japonicum]|uniref:Cytochrome c family protein n=1 Tax=Bradyrhizobium japonicum TaxID=375 RepID=A0A1Y2JNV1_BRAJP|nr:cytochrome c family protein [Bradyrhizobium japonicum]OSJ32515.1 cytochrome c family protein [Bradyrhizobium japonicum]